MATIFGKKCDGNAMARTGPTRCRVARLDEEMGIALFQRTAQGVEPSLRAKMGV